MSKLKDLIQDNSDSLNGIVGIGDVDEESKRKTMSKVPLSFTVFVNAIQVFLHDLCFFIPHQMEEGKLNRMVTKAANINKKVIKLLSKLMEAQDVEIEPMKIVKLQDWQLIDLNYIDMVFKQTKFPSESSQSMLLD
jgi:hypothetical protein